MSSALGTIFLEIEEWLDILHVRRRRAHDREDPCRENEDQHYQHAVDYELAAKRKIGDTVVHHVGVVHGGAVRRTTRRCSGVDERHDLVRRLSNYHGSGNACSTQRENRYEDG